MNNLPLDYISWENNDRISNIRKYYFYDLEQKKKKKRMAKKISV